MNPALLLDPAVRARKVIFPFFSVVSHLSILLPLFDNLQVQSAVMDLDAIDFEMGDGQFYDATSRMASPLDAVQEWLDASHDTTNNFAHTTPQDMLSDTTLSDTELTPHFPGQQAAQQDQTPPATPRFDPAALLNPKSAPKRPASSTGEETERGRADPTISGQVSLVERLHNVQERTASPAKRVKTADEQQRGKRLRMVLISVAAVLLT